MSSDAAYQELPPICIWLVDTPQACVVTFLSNPLSELISYDKTGEQILIIKYKFFRNEMQQHAVAARENRLQHATTNHLSITSSLLALTSSIKHQYVDKQNTQNDIKVD